MEEDDRYAGLAEIDGSLEVLRMKMDAMMWAAKAKDAELAALQAAVREGRERERRLEADLAGLAVRLERAELAEEHLAAEIAELEAEAFERARTHKLQVDSLNADLREKEKLLANATGQLSLYGNGKGKHVDDVERSVSKKLQGTPPRRSPARYPRSPARTTPAVKLSSLWWPWARKSINDTSTTTTTRTPPRVAKLPKQLFSSPASSSGLHTPLTIS